jgi:hypothetical protein
MSKSGKQALANAVSATGATGTTTTTTTEEVKADLTNVDASIGDAATHDELLGATTEEAEAATEEVVKTVKFTYPISAEYRDILNALPTKSARIRQMAADGYKTAQIAKTLDIIYQHARNVLNQIVKKSATPINTMNASSQVVVLTIPPASTSTSTSAAAASTPKAVQMVAVEHIIEEPAIEAHPAGELPIEEPTIEQMVDEIQQAAAA